MLADDHAALLSSLARFLSGERIDVVGRARTGAGALRLLAQHRPDVAVIDFRLPDTNGIEVAREAAEIAPDTGIVIYTSFGHSKLVRDALAVGVRAVVLKDAEPSQLLRAISEVAAGRVYVDPRLRPHRGQDGREQGPAS
jgi:DNA-binding NarL/FixJ family response regulator